MSVSQSLPAKILIVDDVASSRELLRTVLERLGHFVIEAGGGEEALMRLEEQTPDLIFLDLKIPPPNGYELVKRIHGDTRWSSVRVCAFTAEAMKGEREKALSAGFNGYVTKPVGLSGIRDEVQRMLRQSPGEGTS